MPQQAKVDPWAAVASEMNQAPQQKGSAAQAADDPWSAGDEPDTPEQTTLQKIGSGAEDFGKGILKGAASTDANLNDMVAKIPGVGRWLTTPILNGDSSEQARSNEHAAAEAHGAMQSIGKGVEQAGEFLVPGLGEDAVASKIPTLLEGATEAAPKLMKMGRYAASAIGSGAVNKAQGGGFGTGALMGAAGEGIMQGGKALAPIVAEKAMGIRGFDRAFNRTPGEAIMAETDGVSPGTIARQAGGKVGGYTSDLNGAARDSEVPFDMQPARDTAQSWLESAQKRNNLATIKDVGKIGQQLDTRGGEVISPFVSADEALALRRGIDDLHGSFSPNTQSDFTDRAVDATRGVMNDGLDEVIPGYKNLTSKISTLIPVAKRAGATDLNESLFARLLTRGGARTGAGILGVAGGYGGYKEDGAAGAILGGLGGMFGPELLTHPTTLMIGARAADSPVLRKIVPAVGGAALHAGRSVFANADQ